MPAVLTLLAALGVTVLGTDLPVLIPSYGLREVGSFIAKPLYISHSWLLPSTSLPVACKCLWAAEPHRHCRASFSPAPSIQASLLAQPRCQTEQQEMSNRELSSWRRIKSAQVCSFVVLWPLYAMW